MTLVRAEHSASIGAPAGLVYSLIADYRKGHPRILPPKYFPRLDVEQGGTGAGTIILFEMRAFGTTRKIRAAITEPEPGRVLVETDFETGARTMFTVTPETASTCRVTIATEWERKGLRGWIEKRTAPGFLVTVYAEELALLESVATIEGTK